MTEVDRLTGLIYLPRDLTQRLAEGLIRYNGVPFYVERVSTDPLPNGDVQCNLLGMNTLTGEELLVRLPDSALDIRPVPLGYVNGNKKTWYVRRIPTRRYKQSLSFRVLIIDGPGMEMSKTSFLMSRGFARCVMNDYPSFRSAISSVKRTRGQRAFCRRFALEYDAGLKEIYLSHRGVRVGVIDDNGVPVLTKKNAYLQEELESVI